MPCVCDILPVPVTPKEVKALGVRILADCQASHRSHQLATNHLLACLGEPVARIYRRVANHTGVANGVGTRFHVAYRIAAERRASPTAAGEAGGAEKRYTNLCQAPSGKRGRQSGAGAPFDPLQPRLMLKEPDEVSDCFDSVIIRIRPCVPQTPPRPVCDVWQ